MKIQGRTLRVGTLEYMSSETVLAKGHDKATEWWSVGILLYEMLTGKVSMHLLARAPMLLVVTWNLSPSMPIIYGYAYMSTHNLMQRGNLYSHLSSCHWQYLLIDDLVSIKDQVKSGYFMAFCHLNWKWPLLVLFCLSDQMILSRFRHQDLGLGGIKNSTVLHLPIPWRYCCFKLMQRTLEFDLWYNLFSGIMNMKS